VSLVGRLRPRPRPLATAPALRRASTARGGTAGSLQLGPQFRPRVNQQFRPPLEITRSVARSIGRYRALIAAGCFGLAAIIGFTVATSRPANGTAVIAAARDLPAGAVLTAADLRDVVLAPTTVPAGAIRAASAAVGRTTSGALRAGEPLTDVRLTDGPLAAPAQGMVASAVRLADAQAVGLLRAGEHVDVLAASTATWTTSTSASNDTAVAPSTAAVVAADVTVVAIPPQTVGAVADQAFEGALVVLATTPDQARRLAQAQVSDRLSAIVIG